MYRLRWYCCAILNGGRFGDLRTTYQGCRALPFALAGLSCCNCENLITTFFQVVIKFSHSYIRDTMKGKYTTAALKILRIMRN